jgi:hypothetical protein
MEDGMLPLMGRAPVNIDVTIVSASTPATPSEPAQKRRHQKQHGVDSLLVPVSCAGIGNLFNEFFVCCTAGRELSAERCHEFIQRRTAKGLFR